MNKRFKELHTFLSEELEKPLPGEKSHQKMVPTKDGITFRPSKPRLDSKKSAVLILLNYESSSDKFNILYTLRSSKLSTHSGQISFPGGRMDKGEDIYQTALRETEEEVGIKSNDIELLGSISPLFVPPSNSVIYPVIGLSQDISSLIINPDEVEEAFYVPKDTLQNNDILKIKKQHFTGIGEAEVPYFDIHKKAPLWGATAIITSEFLDIIKTF